MLVPVLIDRGDAWSGSRDVHLTNLPHREMVFRMAFQLGRHIIGYEVQKVLAAVDWFRRDKPALRIGVMGYGEGGQIALYSTVADPRIDAVAVSGYFESRQEIWRKPFYRNVWGLLDEFGDAELAGLLFKNLGVPDRLTVAFGSGGGEPGNAATLHAFLRALGVKAGLKSVGAAPVDRRGHHDPLPRLRRQFEQLIEFTQKVARRSENVRREFWSKADRSSPEKWGASLERHRKYLWEEVIGRCPPPSEPLEASTRRVYDEPKWSGYEVHLPVWPDVFAYGILLLPKDLKPGEKRPVVVCQHGVNRRVHYIADPKLKNAYNHFAARLAQLLFVDPARIGFYGLSYGGETALRVPPLLKRYALSISSGNFNEWVWKTTGWDSGYSFLYGGGYDHYDFDIGNTFNCAELANMMAPRPFMVERGHRDGVGPDEWVAYEYSKVRRHFADLGIPERTAIESFNGGHEINARGTFEFLHRHLNWPQPSR